MADEYVAPSPERWRKIETLFAQARLLAPDQRDAFLESACADDAALRDDLDRLLAALDDADGFLEGLDTERAAALLDDEAPDAEQTIGPYRVLREIGRGGMGAVFLAQRATGQFDQQVALKLVKRGMDSQAILRRFLHERQILARLNHPHIARLLDGDVADDGRPYFAMEYVDGVPLTRYCDRRRLGVEARLRLFLDVCRAVQYAHQNLVVHRDLKPSNMLVTEEGELKLLDFGIAKLLSGEEEAGVTTLTEAGFRAMTPEYAAPEQVRGEAVTTATDVYALGVVLYELLTGHRPYRFERRTPEAVARVLSEAEPERPSAAVSRTEERRRADGTTETITPERVSRERGGSPDRLRRRLSGDLDTVVLKALRKEPERRYASTEAFLEDVKRHLAGLPVAAHRDTLGYRASKFVRRHKVRVAVALAFVVLLAGSTVALALQQTQTARERDKAEEVKDFLVSLFEVSDPNASKGETITARELLDQGALRIEQELADQPDVQAELMTVVGEIQQKLGLYDAAQPLLEQALALRRRTLGEAHPDVATSLNNLATLHYLKGDYEAAEPLYRQALALDRERYPGDHLDVARSLNNLSVLVRAQGNYDEADSLAQQALTMRRTLLGEEHTDVAESLVNVAVARYLKGDYDTAEPLYREALAMEQTLLGEAHLRVAATTNRLALLLHRKREYEEAERLFRKTLAIYHKLLGQEHPDVAMTLTNLATVFNSTGDYAAAEPLFREALAMQRKLLGETHPDVAITINNLAGLLRRKGDNEAAEPLYREVLALWRTSLGPEHPYVAVGLNNLATVLDVMGDHAAAEPLFREALAMRRKLLGDEHEHVAQSLNNLAVLLHTTGDYDEADALFREALAMNRKLLGEEHSRTVSTLVELSVLLLDRNRPAEAEPLLRQALAVREKTLREGHPSRANTQSLLGACLSALGRYDEAEPLLLDGYNRLKETQGEQDRATQRARTYLAAHYERRGLSEQAAALRQARSGN